MTSRSRSATSATIRGNRRSSAATAYGSGTSPVPSHSRPSVPLGSGVWWLSTASRNASTSRAVNRYRFRSVTM
jgi:hypothetical protein